MTRSRKRTATTDPEEPINPPARRTRGQLAKKADQEKAAASRAKWLGKQIVKATDSKKKGKKGDPVEVDSGGDESDAKNYGSTLGGNFSHANQSEKQKCVPMFRDEYHIQFWDVNRHKKFVIERHVRMHDIDSNGILESLLGLGF